MVDEDYEEKYDPSDEGSREELVKNDEMGADEAGVLEGYYKEEDEPEEDDDEDYEKAFDEAKRSRKKS